MTPTIEQLAIVEAAKRSKASLLISAYAGSAKTTTLNMICTALPSEPILSLAFNKKIAEEMAKKLPSHVSCKTLNALGHSIWAATTGKKLILDAKKTYGLIRAQIDDLSGSAKSEAWDTFGEIQSGVRLAKINGYVPPSSAVAEKTLITQDDFYASFEEEPSAGSIDAIDRLLCRSISMGFAGTIDFDDQIYMSTLFGNQFPRFPLVCVDEAQDLSPLNHAMLRRLVTKRLIAVGDAHQSIYGFRGAVHGGMEKLKSTFSMTEMQLSVTFRCPQAIVVRARSRVPDMEWRTDAPLGAIYELASWKETDIPDGAAIICRNNAPLFKIALNLIKDGRGVKLVGSDIGPGLIKLLKKLGPETQDQQTNYRAIAKWEDEALRKSRSPGSVHDRADCLRIFVSQAPSLSGAIAYAEHLFATSGPIQLMSGHKSKGLEFETVFHLDPWRIPSQYAKSPAEHEQELNIDYVITTRASKELFLVDADGYSGAR